MMILERVTGPECPQCGCQDCKKAGKIPHWRQKWQRWQCYNCGKKFSRPIKEGTGLVANVVASVEDVIFHTIRCPFCRSKKTRIARTMRPHRYHKCSACGENFRSTEAD